MKSTQQQMVFLRTFALTSTAAIFLLSYFLFTSKPSNKFETIDVERINIVEADGTTKMIITNVEKFPNGDTKINGRPTNKKRKKRSGMLFFNEEGIENGGFIYDGTKDEKGHSAGMSLTFDQFDGDQVMQLLTRDWKRNGKRFVSSYLTFNDQPKHLTQAGKDSIMHELNTIKDMKLKKMRYQELAKQGMFGTSRLRLGSTPSGSNGLFLMDDQGKMRASFMIDIKNNVSLKIFDENGKIKNTWPN